MQIYIDALDYILPILKNYTKNLFNNVGIRIVSRGEDPEIAAKELNTLYFAEIQKLVNSWRKSVEKEQLKLDTPEHYILENKICEELEAIPEF
jgi:deoxyadenosine/deoxycytidine kinase